MNKILIIEDDLEINALLADFLKEKGYAVKATSVTAIIIFGLILIVLLPS